MSRFDIVALTLAEIALVMLFAFLAVLLPGYAKARKLNVTLQAAGKQTISPEEADRLRRENERLRAENEKQSTKLRSEAMPSCVELHKATGPIFTVSIKAANRYGVDGNVWSFRELLQEFSGQINEAARNRCRQKVDVTYAPGVPTSDYVAGLRALRGVFYTSILGDSD